MDQKLSTCIYIYMYMCVCHISYIIIYIHTHVCVCVMMMCVCGYGLIWNGQDQKNTNIVFPGPTRRPRSHLWQKTKEHDVNQLLHPGRFQHLLPDEFCNGDVEEEVSPPPIST